MFIDIKSLIAKRNSMSTQRQGTLNRLKDFDDNFNFNSAILHRLHSNGFRRQIYNTRSKKFRTN